jgi:hypothetical protein
MVDSIMDNEFENLPNVFQLIPEPSPDELFTFGGVEINNFPLQDLNTEINCPLCETNNFQTYSENLPVGIQDFELNDTETGWQAEAFGVKLNDRDDVFTVGAVLLIVVIAYIIKASIDHWFNCRLERYRIRLDKN